MGSTEWAPLWQFLWGDHSQEAADIQRQLDLPDQALVAYAALRHRGLPCPGPLRGAGKHALKRLAARGLRRWARALGGEGSDAPVGRWLFRAAGGAPLPFLEHQVARLRGGAPDFEYYRDADGQLRSQINPRAVPAAAPADEPAAPDTASSPETAAARAQEAAEEEQVAAVEHAENQAQEDDSTRLPPLPPPFSMYSA